MRWLLCLIFLSAFNLAFGQKIGFHPRDSKALTGTQIRQLLEPLSLEDREKCILEQLALGNVPPHLRNWQSIREEVQLNGKSYRIRLKVASDFLALGSDEDFFYMPMTPVLAQKIADQFNSLLPTAKLSDLIWKHADVKFEPRPITPSAAMVTVPVFWQHQQILNGQLENQRPLNGKILAGHKKDIVISNRLYRNEKLSVVIYGWHHPDGKAIQPEYNGHTFTWADYSHGVRLISKDIRINGKKMDLEQALKDPELAKLFHEPGPLAFTRYPTK